jgi:hypothetical protein
MDWVAVGTGMCVVTCPVGKYVNFILFNNFQANTSTMVCEPCDSRCAVCTGWSNMQCSACTVGNYLQANLNRCDTYCDPGWVKPGSSPGTCVACPA